MRLIDPFSILLFVFTTFLCIIVSEAVMRFHMFGNDGFSYSKMKSIRHIGESGLIQAANSLDILWELKPNLNKLYKLYNFKTNSDGLRDQDYQIPKPKGVYRVAVIGDSYTMGEGVAINEIYHSRLEQKLNSPKHDIKFEFINFGVAGYSLPQYRATISHKVIKYQVDLILIGFCAANDTKKPNLEAFRQPYQVKPEFNGFFNIFIFEHIGNLYKRIYNKFKNRYPGYNADENYLYEEFSELSKIAVRHNLPVLIAYIDNKAASADYEMVKKAAEKNNFYFINGTNNFSNKLSEDHIIYKTDNHPNGRANKIIAESLYHELTIRNDNPLSKKIKELKIL